MLIRIIGRNRVVAAGTLVLTGLFGTGCFSYVSNAGGGPLPARGENVRILLEQPSRFSLTDLTAERIIRLEGEVVRWEPDNLLVSALWLWSQTDVEFKAAGETLVIPRADIATLEVKQVSTGKTIGLIAVLVGLSAAFAAVVGAAGGGGGGDGGGTPTPTQ